MSSSSSSSSSSDDDAPRAGAFMRGPDAFADPFAAIFGQQQQPQQQQQQGFGAAFNPFAMFGDLASHRQQQGLRMMGAWPSQQQQQQLEEPEEQQEHGKAAVAEGARPSASNSAAAAKMAKVAAAVGRGSTKRNEQVDF